MSANCVVEMYYISINPNFVYQACICDNTQLAMMGYITHKKLYYDHTI